MKRFVSLYTFLLIALVCRAENAKIDNVWYALNAEAKQAEVMEPQSGDTHSGDIVIPEKVTHNGAEYLVTSVGEYAFYECTDLTSISLPSSVTSIGNDAFYKCSSMTSITLSNSVTSIGNDAFSHCSSLTSIDLPNSVTSIGEYAFYRCSSLTNIVLPNSVTSIGQYAFRGCSSLTSITIPSSVTSIQKSVFHECSSLTSITIPNSVTSIGTSAFYGCSSLTNITIPNSVTSIGSHAFRRCTSLTSIAIPQSVTSIDDYTFDGCSSLTSIILPNSVTSIGNYAFAFCTNLTHFYCYAEEAPFANSETTFYEFPTITSATLHVPANALEEYKTTEPWGDFGTIIALTDEEIIQGIDSTEAPSIHIQAYDGNIVLQGAKAGTPVSIYSVSGTQVASGIVGSESALTLPTTIPAGDVVIVQVGAQRMKMIMK